MLEEHIFVLRSYESSLQVVLLVRDDDKVIENQLIEFSSLYVQLIFTTYNKTLHVLSL